MTGPHQTCGRIRANEGNALNAAKVLWERSKATSEGSGIRAERFARRPGLVPAPKTDNYIGTKIAAKTSSHHW